MKSAAKRTEVRTGEKAPQNPESRIQNYLNRFNEILDHKDPEKRERGMEALKRVLHDKFVIKPEEIPEGYFENQRRIAREQGHGDIEITNETRGQLTEVIIADQRSSLDKWIDYLSSPDATYPDWLKYYAVRSILGMGEFDKEKKQFTKRSKGTTKPFPDLNREALAYVLDAIRKKQAGIKTIPPINIDTDEAEYEKFEKLLQGENFAKLYAWAIEKVTPTEKNLLAVTKGRWIKYEKNSDHMPLVKSLQGHGTGWCVAGESTAESYLKLGDFYVYYSEDANGKSIIPCAAIQMNEEQIGQVRGIAYEQNLDPYIGGVVQEKLKSFPDGAAYEKKSADMKFLTEIENKTKQGEQLTKDDLIFLYEMNAPIEGFGYERDPRIAELRVQRNPEKDMPIIFECAKDQIAHNTKEINKNTKAYVGPLVPGIFNKIQEYGIEHIYTSFPEDRIRKEIIKIGGKDAETLIKEMREKKINISDNVMSMLQSKEFTTQRETEDAILVRLKVKDLGINKEYPTTDDIYQQIEKLGLELCPAEVGPNYRLQYQNQPLGEWFLIGMKQVSSSRGGRPRIFGLGRQEYGLWLDGVWMLPVREWNPISGFVFRFRKLKNLETRQKTEN